jgi:hypothetical protein
MKAHRSHDSHDGKRWAYSSARGTTLEPETDPKENWGVSLEDDTGGMKEWRKEQGEQEGKRLSYLVLSTCLPSCQDDHRNLQGYYRFL